MLALEKFNKVQNTNGLHFCPIQALKYTHRWRFSPGFTYSSASTVSS